MTTVDHKILTIDGRGTLHVMGIVAALILGRKKDCVIPRRQITNMDFLEKNKIPIIEHQFAKHVRKNIVFKKLVNNIIIVD